MVDDVVTAPGQSIVIDFVIVAPPKSGMEAVDHASRVRCVVRDLEVLAWARTCAPRSGICSRLDVAHRIQCLSRGGRQHVTNMLTTPEDRSAIFFMVSPPTLRL